jgi:glycolate oxidase
MNRRTRRHLEEIFRERAFFELEYRIPYSFDATNRPCVPDCVVFPTDRKEVTSLVDLAAAERFSIVPRCAGSGFSGGTVAVEGGVVLSFERMASIEEIDIDRRLARVQPGVVTGKLQAEAVQLGLMYPPDPASLSFSMIGGNIGTNAGGPRGLKYGTTRDYVRGLDTVVPAFGEVRTEDRASGFDLTPLFVGSEGTLGAIVEARLRLVKAPQDTVTILACFRNMEEAVQVLDTLIGEGTIPSTAEFIDRPTMECAFGESKTDTEVISSNVLIVEVDGWKEEVEEESRKVMQVCRTGGATLVRFARNEEEKSGIWAIRRAISPSLARIAPNKLNPDVCVPRSRLVDYLAFVSSLARKYSVMIFNFGHAGDGNIHTNIMYDAADVVLSEAAESALAELFEKTLALGGTVSGEHGIGVARETVLKMQVGPRELELRRKYKKVFDPENIMNPGKPV